jgi:hypothetical protein
MRDFPDNPDITPAPGHPVVSLDPLETFVSGILLKPDREIGLFFSHVPSQIA